VAVPGPRIDALGARRRARAGARAGPPCRVAGPAAAVRACAAVPGPRPCRALLRSWRRLQEPRLHPADAVRLLERLLRDLAELQDDCSPLVERCPGRTLQGRRQVFARLQRVMLYLEGHLERAPATTELAARASMSVWYFIRAFRALYGETPQAASARMRLQRSARLVLDRRLAISEVGAAC